MFPSAPPLPCTPAQIAWLTLDEEDNDPARFLTALVAALRRLNPACGTTAQTLLASLTNPGAEARRIIGVLINDVLETLPDPFVLILDDLHLITESAAFVALDYLLEHLPPQMHLAVGTRQDPPLALARLRARGQLAELGPADLRFTLDEAELFLNEKLGLGLSPDDLTALQDRTEGWPAGLRLLASSLDRIPTPAGRIAFITDLAQTDRYIFDFLAEEVLSRQEPAVRAFLLETSILSQLTPALCQAVTGRDDAGMVLEDIYRRNLFLVVMDRPPSPLAIQPPSHLAIYRYHALFAEFLRWRLAREMPERLPDLHRRAAEAQTNPSRAIGHYLAAEMWEPAAQAIEQAGKELLNQGLLDTLNRWIHTLPTPVRDARPRLAYFLGVCAWLKGDGDLAQSLLGRALLGFEAMGDEEGQGEVLAELATGAFLQADFERAGEMVHRALGYPLSVPTQVQLRIGRAWVELLQGEQAQAEADLEAALAVAQESGDPDLLRILAMHLGPLSAFLPGGLGRSERMWRQAAAHLGDEISPARVAVECQMAFVHFWRGRLDEAIQAGERALTISRQLGGPFLVAMDAAAVAAVAHAARGDYPAADRFFAALFDQLEATAAYQNVVGELLYLYMLGRTRWLEDRLEEARQVYAQMCAAEQAAELPLASVLGLMMHGLLEMAESRFMAAERSFRQAASVRQHTPFSDLASNPHLMLARLYVEMNRPQEALAELTPVLRECEREGAAGFILQEGAAVVPVLRLAVERGVHATFAAHLLDLLSGAKNLASDEPRPVPVPETGETLTPREVEVLRLIATGASNRVIAEQLVISEHTVKSHVYHIFRKLDVATRTEAAARARDLRLA